MSMDLRSLARSLKESLRDAAACFESDSDADDGELKRLVQIAAADLHRVRPRIQLASLSLSAGQMDYPCPDDLQRFKQDYWWNDQDRFPWNCDWPGVNPRVVVARLASGRVLRLTPAPSSQQIGALGATFHYDYFAVHSVAADAADTTVLEQDRDLLILRAQAEAMKELAMRNMHKPVQLRDTLNSAPKNSTPAALYEQLLRHFERQGAPC